jgi:TonB family protein
MRSIALLIFWTAAQIAPARSAIVSGRLLSTDETPVAGVEVIALETAWPRLKAAARTETDNDGRYRLENLPAGEYFIVADPFKVPSYYPGVGNRDDSTPVSVTAGAIRTGVDFKFVRSSGLLRAVRKRSVGETGLSGVLQDRQGKALASFTVMLSNSNTDARLWTVTDASGSFEFRSLTAGDFSIEASAPVDELYEDLQAPLTLHADETLDIQLGVRQIGNFQQRPDLYGPVSLRERVVSLSQTGPGEPSFWRCQRADSQAKPEYSEALRAAGVKGSVTLLVNVDAQGELVRLRMVSANSNPELIRAALKAVAQWKFTPLKFERVSSGQTMVSCNGAGAAQDFQGTVTFDFPPA